MKTAVITGASKGLGKALALAFAEQGYNVAICARTESELMKVKDKIVRKGGNVLAVRADVSVARDVDLFISLAEQRFGNIDVLVNNAGILGPSPMPLLLDYPDSDYLEVLRVNAMNPFLMMKRVLPGMVQRDEGSIINVTSEAGATGFAGWGAYGISKFAVEGLTETWADELQETNIRVNLVDPGGMDTDMHELAVPDRDYDLPKPGDVVDVFLYLASDSSSGITGKRFEAQEFKMGKEEM